MEGHLLGRIYDSKIKKVGDRLLEAYGDSLGIDFNQNKEIVAAKLKTKSKFVINKVTGYVTSKIRRMRTLKVEEAQPEVDREQSAEV